MLFVGVAVCRSCSVWVLQCARVAVCGSCGVGELWRVIVTWSESCNMGITVVTEP